MEIDDSIILLSGVRRPRLTLESLFFRQARTPDGTLKRIPVQPVIARRKMKERARYSCHKASNILVLSLLFFLFSSSNSLAKAFEFDADNAFAYLEKQCEFGTREPGSEGARQCLAWFEETFRQFGAEVYLQRFEALEAITGKKRRLTNVIAYFPAESASTLMLCAHWDTRAHANLDPDPANRSKPIMGANDGASGVAVLLEMAKIASMYAPPQGLLIVLFDGEDMGRASHAEEFALGSKFWASHQIPVEVDEAILLDMIGDEDLEILIEGYSERYASGLRKELWHIAEQLELPAFVDRYGAIVADDHVNLQQVGIRAIDLIDMEYTYWHTLEDTPDKCSAESLGQVGRALVGYIYGVE